MSGQRALCQSIRVFLAALTSGHCPLPLRRFEHSSHSPSDPGLEDAVLRVPDRYAGAMMTPPFPLSEAKGQAYFIVAP